MSDDLKHIAHAPLYLWLPCAVSLVFVCAAGVHKLQMGTENYVGSPLIAVEMLSLLLLSLLLMAQVVFAVVLAVQRRWMRLLVVGINVAVSIGAILAGMVIDAPTVVFMTQHLRAPGIHHNIAMVYARAAGSCSENI
jgi:nitric oxide reductase large subunit